MSAGGKGSPDLVNPTPFPGVQILTVGSKSGFCKSIEPDPLPIAQICAVGVFLPIRTIGLTYVIKKSKSVERTTLMVV